jgi:hypothetical protein
MPSDMAYRKEFGSWGNALRYIGFEPLKPYPSEECMVNMIKSHTGKTSCASKGGKITTIKGYIQIWMPDHPNSNKTGYVFEHRLIMSNYINRPLNENEDVHHINGNKSDNRIENLKLMTKSDHTKTHENKDKHIRDKTRNCIYYNCIEKTSSKYGLCTKHYRMQWARVRDGLIPSIEVIGNIHANPELLEATK